MNLWLDDSPVLSKGWRFSIRITKTLESFKSEYQQVDVVESEAFGRVLVLDGVIQVTEKDEPNYHEMMTHVPMLSHPNPKRVLVIGGGDGGIVREVLKHPSVEEVHFCELDEAVVQIALKYFPSISSGLSDPRVKHVYIDGTSYIKKFKDHFDVIIVDSTDPEGPGEVLFLEPFFKDVKIALTKDGICVTQALGFVDEAEAQYVKKMFEFLPGVFPHYGYFWTLIQTYASGMCGLTFLSNGINPYAATIDLHRVPTGLKYYSSDIHRASFALPEFAKRYIPAGR